MNCGQIQIDGRHVLVVVLAISNLVLISSKNMSDLCPEYFHILSIDRCNISVFPVFGLTQFVRPSHGSLSRLQPDLDRYIGLAIGLLL